MNEGAPARRSAAITLGAMALTTGSWAAVADAALDRMLRVGTRVEIKGAADESATFTARQVTILRGGDDDDELRGAIESIDASHGTFRLLGFTVRCSERTRFSREPDEAAGFDELTPGLRVKVDGRQEGDGAFEAKKVRIREDQLYRERKLVGTISAVEPASDGDYPTLRVLDVRVALDRSTELVGPGGRPRPLLRRRLGAVDDDDDLDFGRHKGRRVGIAGEVRLRHEVLSNPELDRSAGDGSSIPEVFAIVGMAVDLGPLFAYAEVEGFQEFLLRGGDEFEQGDGDVHVGEAYLQVRPAGAPWFSVALGRQKFAETREWHYDTKNLDALRLTVDYFPWSVEASISRDLLDDSRNAADQQRVNVIVQAGYQVHPEVRLEGYYIDRRDREAPPDSPRISALRLLADPGRRVELWLDVARETGHRALVEGGGGTRVVVRPIRAWAVDAGLTVRPRVKLDPTFTLAWAGASGDPAGTFDERAGRADRGYRQSGLERNRGKVHGVVSFRYYGEVLDPELTNLGILSAGVGIRPRRSVSLDLVYHRYRQDEPRADLHGTDVDRAPEGLRPELGDELDLILGYEPHRALELRLTLGRFRPGAAYPADATSAAVGRFQARFRF